MPALTHGGQLRMPALTLVGRQPRLKRTARTLTPCSGRLSLSKRAEAEAARRPLQMRGLLVRLRCKELRSCVYAPG